MKRVKTTRVVLGEGFLFMNRGQAGLEMVLVIGFMLLVSLGFLWLLQGASQQGADEANVLQAQQAVQTIARSCDEVYFQGGNAEKTIQVFIPQNVEKIIIGAESGWGNEVVFQVSTSYGKTEAIAMSSPQISAPDVGQPPAKQEWLEKPAPGIIPLKLKLNQIESGSNEYGVEITVVKSEEGTQ